MVDVVAAIFLAWACLVAGIIILFWDRPLPPNWTPEEDDNHWGL